jgi:hypothetical protein
MDGITKLSFIVSIIVLLVGASCARVPQEDQGPPSGESRSTDVNSTSIVQPAESSSPITESPTPNDVSLAVEMDSHRQSVGDLPAARFVGTEIDINSGDLRGARSILDGPPWYEVYESELSKEVRRLGIPIPEEPQWMVISGPPSGGMRVTYIYSRLLPAARMLLQFFDEANASDEERRAVLQRLMTSLRTEQPPDAIEKAHMLVLEVVDRHGLESPFLPDYAGRLQQLRSEQE